MTAPEFLVLGHITRDLIPSGFKLGGTVTYSALTASRLGWRVGVITACSPDLELGQTLTGIEICRLDSPQTTTFRNTYLGEERQQWIIEVASSIGVQDVPPEWRRAPVVHLGPVAGELDPALAACFPHSLVLLTVQGWLRGWDGGGKVYRREWTQAPDVLPQISVLIVSERDAGMDVIKNYAALAPLAVVTRGSRGARVHARGTWYDVPSFPVRVADPTGAGDIFAAAFITEYAHKRDALAAASFASAVASLALEQGIDKLTQRKVAERLSKLENPAAGYS